MEEKEHLSYKKRKKNLSFIRRIKAGHKNLKSNYKLCLYIIFIIIVFLLVLFFSYKILKNKKFSHTIFVTQNNKKDYHKNYIKNENANIEISKNIFEYKVDKIIEEKIKALNQIHISYSLDNKLIFPTLISMLSGLENNNNNKSIIIYHLLLSHDFNTLKVDIFESLKMNYTVKINYYIIPQIFSYSSKWTAGTDCIYYKILLPIMFPNLERIIYIDGDTLIRKDISEMYNYPFGDNYILGFPFYMTYVMDKHGINATHYINGGCLLFNIDKI